jgi:hypothetical protein
MHLAKLIDVPARDLTKQIAKLEELSGYRSEDVRLLDESRRQLAGKISALGLDPSDTTGEELYETLKVKLQDDLSHVSRAWNLEDDGLDKVVQIVSANAGSDELLSIRRPVMKALLKKSPPKKTIKLLGYRSLDSMLKHEDAAVVVAIALANENQQWNSHLAHSISALKTSDYELHQVRFFGLNPKQSAALEKPVIAVPLMSTVLLAGREDSKQLAASVVLAFEAEAILTADNDFLSRNQFSKDFNKKAEQAFSGTTELNVVPDDVLGFGNKLNLSDPCTRFSNLHPCLAWWKKAGHLALYDGGPVSLNLTDNILNLIAKVEYSQRYAVNFTKALKADVANRYLSYPAVKNYFNRAVDDTFITLDSISAKQLAPDFEEIRNL